MSSLGVERFDGGNQLSTRHQCVEFAKEAIPLRNTFLGGVFHVRKAALHILFLQ
jgi:hypothetical protein